MTLPTQSPSLSDVLRIVADEQHVYPTFGREHVMTMECWCLPERDPEEPKVVIHHVEQ